MAATIQWIPERVAFSKCFELLKNGGYLAMLTMRGDYRTPNEALYNDIQKVYDEFFKPETPYTQRLEYGNAVNYGFVDFSVEKFHGRREYSADEYIQYIGTHCDHIVLKEPYKSAFYAGIKKAVAAHGGKVVFDDTVVLYLTRKP